jgi:hypothetical protein
MPIRRSRLCAGSRASNGLAGRSGRGPRMAWLGEEHHRRRRGEDQQMTNHYPERRGGTAPVPHRAAPAVRERLRPRRRSLARSYGANLSEVVR